MPNQRRVFGAGLRRRSGPVVRAALLVGLAVSASASLPATSLGTADTTAPELLIAAETIDGPVVLDHVVLLFSEPLDATSIPDLSDLRFRIVDPGPFPSPEPTPTPAQPVSAITFLYAGLVGGASGFFPDGMTVLRVDLGTTVSQSDLVRLTYTPGAHPFRDLAGNAASAFIEYDVSFIGGVNDVLPWVDDGLGPDHVILMTSRALDPALPPASDFTVRINGTPYTPTSVTLLLPGYGLGFVDLALPVSVAAADTVALAYAESSPVLMYLAGLPIGAFDQPALVTLPAVPTRATPTGTAVVVSPPDSTTGASTVAITFDSVSASGTTTAASSATGPAAPSGFSFGDPAVYYELATTASFTSAEVCFSYDPTRFAPPESAIRLLHWTGAAWVDTTSAGYPDLINHRICGTTTSFSPFAIAGPPPIAFSGFFAPVDNPPVVNAVQAGSAIPVKFSLGGNRGLLIFAPGSPSSVAVACSDGAPIDVIEQTVSPGSVTLTYNGSTDRYLYVWKTSKSWSGCRKLTLAFPDGSAHSAIFRFR